MLVYCPNCKNELEVPEEFVGMTGTCKYCNEKVSIPSAPTEQKFGNAFSAKGILDSVTPIKTCATCGKSAKRIGSEFVDISDKTYCPDCAVALSTCAACGKRVHATAVLTKHENAYYCHACLKKEAKKDSQLNGRSSLGEFPVLWLMSVLLRIIGGLGLVSLPVLAVMPALEGEPNKYYYLLGCLISSGITLAYAEFIELALAIERNTRKH